MHTLEEMIEMIEDTYLEYKAYCYGKDCEYESCAILRNKRKLGKDNETDCLVLFTLYKLGVDQEEDIKEINKKYMDYCRGRDKSCIDCKMFDFKYNNFDHNDLPYCRICYVVLYINDMLDLIGERK